MKSTFEFVKVEICNRVAWFRFNRPPRNSVNWEMLYELAPALQGLMYNDEVKVIVLGAEVDGYFSTGADVSSFANVRSEKMAEWVKEM